MLAAMAFARIYLRKGNLPRIRVLQTFVKYMFRAIIFMLLFIPLLIILPFINPNLYLNLASSLIVLIIAIMV